VAWRGTAGRGRHGSAGQDLDDNDDEEDEMAETLNAREERQVRRRQAVALETLAKSSERAATALELGVVLGVLHGGGRHLDMPPDLADKLVEGYEPIVKHMLAQVLGAQGFESPDLS
jgi:hypothetical protein